VRRFITGATPVVRVFALAKDVISGDSIISARISFDPSRVRERRTGFSCAGHDSRTSRATPRWLNFRPPYNSCGGPGGKGVPIIFYCPRCGREIRVRSVAAGRKGRCADCMAEIVVPDFNAIDPSRRPVTDPCANNAPDIQGGFVDNGEANQA
jgi:hypothetical protein